ncbi:MAG: hypothetical protein H0X24_15685 [Ktedonobacterales bacterium]|nr:hypothetical protein [Ktedonobacterales bacterium]
MRSERERSVPRRPQVLVVSAPGDPRAARLSDDLQEIGWRVILADTPEMAEDYAESAFCVVVLRARQWNAAPIAATVRARPPELIPVLAESMDLPRGPWTFEPIPMESPRQVANEVAEALDDAARTQRGGRGPGPGASYPPRGDSFGSSGYTREPRGPIDRSGPYGRGSAGIDNFPRSMPNRASVRVGVPPPPPPAAKKRGAGRGIGILLTLLVMAGLAFGGVKYGYPYVKRHYLTTTSAAPAKPAPYAAALPGPSCDTGAGKANWQPLSDSNITGTCQANNYLLKQSGSFSTAAEVFFKPAAAYPRSYQVGITGTIVSGDSNVAVGIDVHHQLKGGGHLFAAYKGGNWHAILGTAPGGTPQRLGFGFLAKPDSTFTMLVDVQGPTMSFTVNGTKVVTLTEGSYASTDAVAFFLYDFGATAPASATFSQFSYTPEADPTLSTASLLATATAQATTAAKQPYTTATPGFGCDKGIGQWQPQFLQAAGTTTQCDTKGLHVTQDPKASTRGVVEFYGLNGLLANDYVLSTKVALDATTSCGGFITRRSAEATSFDRLVVCGTGLWAITSTVNGATKGTPMNGFVTPALSYTIAVNVKGSTQVLSINGTQVATLTDTSNSTTYALGLAAVMLGDVKGTATFTNFSYTAQ